MHPAPSLRPTILFLPPLSSLLPPPLSDMQGRPQKLDEFAAFYGRFSETVSHKEALEKSHAVVQAMYAMLVAYGGRVPPSDQVGGGAGHVRHAGGLRGQGAALRPGKPYKPSPLNHTKFPSLVASPDCSVCPQGGGGGVQSLHGPKP